VGDFDDVWVILMTCGLFWWRLAGERCVKAVRCVFRRLQAVLRGFSRRSHAWSVVLCSSESSHSSTCRHLHGTTHTFKFRRRKSNHIPTCS